MSKLAKMLMCKPLIASHWRFLLYCSISEATTSSTICIWLIYQLNRHTQKNTHPEEALWFQRSIKFISNLHHSSYMSDTYVAVLYVQQPSLHPSTSMDNQALTMQNTLYPGHHKPTQTGRGSKLNHYWSETNFLTMMNQFNLHSLPLCYIKKLNLISKGPTWTMPLSSQWHMLVLSHKP